MKIISIHNNHYQPHFEGAKEKLIDKILTADNPKKIKILISDVDRICTSMGLERLKKRGSHVTYKISENKFISFVNPHGNKRELSHCDKSKFQSFLKENYKKTELDILA